MEYKSFIMSGKAKGEVKITVEGDHVLESFKIRGKEVLKKVGPKTKRMDVYRPKCRQIRVRGLLITDLLNHPEPRVINLKK